MRANHNIDSSIVATVCLVVFGYVVKVCTQTKVLLWLPQQILQNTYVHTVMPVSIIEEKGRRIIIIPKFTFREDNNNKVLFYCTQVSTHSH